MPRKLAASLTPHAFWYKPLPSPPKNYDKWEDLVYNFAKHLVDRYGADEVAQWYFEVWNEPNIDFWTGQPKKPHISSCTITRHAPSSARILG